jgi:hypothetical protein
MVLDVAHCMIPVRMEIHAFTFAVPCLAPAPDAS